MTRHPTVTGGHRQTIAARKSESATRERGWRGSRWEKGDGGGRREAAADDIIYEASVTCLVANQLPLQTAVAVQCPPRRQRRVSFPSFHLMTVYPQDPFLELRASPLRRALVTSQS